jgi:ribulose-5-phosphate 4-epimerase/fuculose-1-phosphate aldolase
MPRQRRLSASRNVLQDLVAANRILARLGVLDAYGHVSVRSDVAPDHFVLSRSLAPSLATLADLILHGPDSEPVADPRRPYLERYIHGEIYRRRPDVMAVVHSHSDSVIPFGATKSTLQPIYHMASFLATGVPVFEIRDTTPDNDLLIRDPRLGAALAQRLGACTCVLMRGHGMTVVGDSLPEAVFRAVYTERNAKLQAMAGQLEGPIRFLSPEEGQRATQTNRATLERPWELWKKAALRRGG